ncbi:hypothetical protein AZE42_06024 [Rhizopogon vesiculosus]|uniref:Uncharacterized protein n=1 Tax=Rhizopogon vesiculosus TaxID=180088 RepID=A0A1J8QD10_9AGAM|nr:hypothetical protein AZE42_06024 [Rhizopogon vesiculosus]
METTRAAKMCNYILIVKDGQLPCPKSRTTKKRGARPVRETNGSPLHSQRTLTSTSFGVLEISHVLSDPTAFEEPAWT